MKKKTMAKIGTLALASMLTVSMFAGCGDGDGNASATGGNANAEYSLQIYVYEQGYGKGWVEKAAQEFVKKYPNYKYSIHSDSGMFTTLYNDIMYDNCKADVALISDANYRELVGAGKLCGLNDLLEAELPDSS